MSASISVFIFSRCGGGSSPPSPLIGPPFYHLPTPHWIPPARRRIQCQPTDSNVAGHHPLARKQFEYLQNLFALAKAVKKNGHCSQVDRMRPEPHQVRRDPL